MKTSNFSLFTAEVDSVLTGDRTRTQGKTFVKGLRNMIDLEGKIKEYCVNTQIFNLINAAKF